MTPTAPGSCRALSRLGFELAGVAATGRDAVTLALTTTPDLVLIDAQLEGDMDGIQAAEQIRLDCAISMCLLTGDAIPPLWSAEG